MNTLIASSIAAFAVLGHQPSYCSTQTNARIVNFGTYGNGNVFVSLDQSIDEPGCPMPYIELPAAGPATKSALATVALAFATNAIVKVQTDSCYNGTPSFSGARPAYIQINRP
jgi:hypothetical protein